MSNTSAEPAAADVELWCEGADQSFVTIQLDQLPKANLNKPEEFRQWCSEQASHRQLLPSLGEGGK